MNRRRIIPALVLIGALSGLTALQLTTSTGGSQILVHYPFTSSGTFEVDANTVSYVTWNGSALVDPYAVTTPWTMVGTVPQNVNSPFYPQGFAAASLKGVGPFNGSTHYARSNPNAIGSITGDFTACVAFKSAGAATETIFSTAGSTDADGYRIYTMSGFGSTVAMRWADGGHTLVTGNTTADVNVACWGRKDGVATTGYLKLNLGTTVSGSVSQIAPTTGTTRIGTSGSGTQSLNGAAFVQWVSLTPWSEALVTRQIARFFGLTSTAGLVPTVTRTTTATNLMPDGTLWTWPAGVARVGTDGLLVEPARANVVVKSASFCKAGDTVETGWTLNAATCQNDVAADPEGASSMDAVTTSAFSGSVYATATVSSSTGPFTCSGFVASDTGSKVESIVCGCGGGAAATATGCWRLDGGACTTGSSGANGWAYGTFTTATTRMSVTITCASAVTQIYPAAHDGQFNASSGVGGRFWGLQGEVGSYATSYVSTSGTAVTRNADVVSITNPLAASNPAKWCVDGTYMPESGRAWHLAGSYPGLWEMTPAGASSVRLYSFASGGGNANRLIFDQNDASSVSRYANPLDGFAAGSAHRIGMSVINGSTINPYLDGVLTSPAAAGTAGAYPATLVLGSANNDVFGGSIKDFKVWKGACR